MLDNQSANFPLLVSRERGENAFADAMRLFVGRGRRYSVKQLSNATGVKDRCIECAMCRSGSPDFRPLHMGAQLSVMQFLGADFTGEWLALAGQGAFDLPDEEPDPGTLAADNCDDNATVVRAAMDGKFDAAERPQLGVVGHRMIERGMVLCAVSGRAA